ncbi:hypothetical protein [Halosimplex sp. J119]
MVDRLAADRYSERTRRITYTVSFVAAGVAVGAVFVLAGEAAGAVALVALVALGNLASRHYPGRVDERDRHVHRVASARTVELLTVGGGLVVAGAVVFDAFDVASMPAWAMPLGWAVAALSLTYLLMAAYERHA